MDHDKVQSSQVSATQAEKAHSSMDRGEQEKKLHDLVQFLLVMDQKKLPIKKLGRLPLAGHPQNTAFGSLILGEHFEEYLYKQENLVHYYYM